MAITSQRNWPIFLQKSIASSVCVAYSWITSWLAIVALTTAPLDSRWPSCLYVVRRYYLHVSIVIHIRCTPILAAVLCKNYPKRRCQHFIGSPYNSRFWISRICNSRFFKTLKMPAVYKNSYPFRDEIAQKFRIYRESLLFAALNFADLQFAVF